MRRRRAFAASIARPPRRGPLLRIAALFALAAAAQLQAAPLTLGVLQRAGDERLEPKRVLLAYPGHPTGPAAAGVQAALDESKFELDAAGVQIKLDVVEVAGADDARQQAARLAKAGALALIADLPPDALLAAAESKLAVFNAGEAADRLRQQDCRANLLHTLPSERMRADALSQWLLARRWQRVLLLVGPREDDKARRAVAAASIAKHGLKLAAERPFKLSADPRERNAANPLLLTGQAEYDAVWVVDSDGEFARSLPYRTALPRPVVGDAGLFAQAWAPNFERFGAPQLARRFQRANARAMSGHDWAAWAAGKAIAQAAVELKTQANAVKLLAGLTKPDFTLDGFKGVRLSFRPWDGQLRQPMLLSDGQGVIGIAPQEGVLHPKNNLDTLGADEPERLCKAAK